MSSLFDIGRRRQRGTEVAEHGLRFGPLGDRCVHLCVDMQRMFAEDTEWHTPWMRRVLPLVCELVAARPQQTVFTRFIPAQEANAAHGTWRRYYRRWTSMTISELGRDMIELVPELAGFVPPAEVVDKRVYSPWIETNLLARLQARCVDTIIVTGGETDVCVLGTVVGAIDHGFRVVVVTDALCSSSDKTHDAMLSLYHERYGQQVETVTHDKILLQWTNAAGS